MHYVARNIPRSSSNKTELEESDEKIEACAPFLRQSNSWNNMLISLLPRWALLVLAWTIPLCEESMSGMFVVVCI